MEANKINNGSDTEHFKQLLINYNKKFVEQSQNKIKATIQVFKF